MKFPIKKAAFILALTATPSFAESKIVKFNCTSQESGLWIDGDLSVPEALWNGTMTEEEFRSEGNASNRPTFQNVVVASQGFTEPPVTRLADTSTRQNSADLVFTIESISDAEADYAYGSYLIVQDAIRFIDGKARYSSFSPYIYEIDDGSEMTYAVECNAVN